MLREVLRTATPRALLWLLCLGGCNSVDASLLERRTPGSVNLDGLADAGTGDDATTAGRTDRDATVPTTDAYTEVCNGEDDDDDGEADEADATRPCVAANGAAACIGGQCIVAQCDEGYRDCDADANNGCEVSLGSVTDCGRCGNDCGGTENVEEASCAEATSCDVVSCAPGFIDCDADPMTGCEASFAEVLNCGGCASAGDNEPCTDLPGVLTSTCEGGSCQVSGCLPGFADCNRTAADGCEQETAIDGCCANEPDSDSDGVLDCLDGCPTDTDKVEPGECGCGVSDADNDSNGIADCRSDCWGFPSNFDPVDESLSFARDGNLTCSPTIDTSRPVDSMITGWCNGEPPRPAVRDQPGAGGPQVVVVPLGRLTVAAGQTLRLIGDKPVILAVQGEVLVDGTIDVGSDHSTAPGAGATASCGTGFDGYDGFDAINDAGSGGGGGGFASIGRVGGLSADVLGALGGLAAPDLGLVPLRAGCHGGDGGADVGAGGRGGRGGGALQISATGGLHVSSTGSISAGGGGGSSGSGAGDGGGGGGSGGALLLEANTIQLDPGSWVTVNGGAGAAGNYSVDVCPAGAGSNGASMSGAPAAGGTGCFGSGTGGNGAAPAIGALPGAGAIANDAGGGGGGGMGVIVQRPLDGSVCSGPR